MLIQKLIMTRNHLVPLCNGALVTARSLSLGMCLTTIHDQEKVVVVQRDVQHSGVYTAVTENEFLVVNGIIASPFALAHGITHAFFNLTDTEQWCSANESLLGASISSKIHDILQRRLLTQEPSDCTALLASMFENYRDHGVSIIFMYLTIRVWSI